MEPRRSYRVGGWSVYTKPDGAFDYAVNDDRAQRIAWTLEDWLSADPSIRERAIKLGVT